MPNIEIWLEPNGDFVLQPNGDLLLAYDAGAATDATRQRLQRLFLTNPRIIGSNNQPISAPDDLFHPDYGAGLPALVGQPISVVMAEAPARIMRWVRLDPTIVQNPPPTIEVTQLDVRTVQIRFACETVDGGRIDSTFPLRVSA